MTASLEGVRVLLVEDEYLVASLIEEILETAGCIVTGPIPRLAEAVDAADRERCDAAVLDVNLAGERIYPVADILSRQARCSASASGVDKSPRGGHCRAVRGKFKHYLCESLRNFPQTTFTYPLPPPAGGEGRVRGADQPASRHRPPHPPASRAPPSPP